MNVFAPFSFICAALIDQVKSGDFIDDRIAKVILVVASQLDETYGIIIGMHYYYYFSVLRQLFL